MILIKNGHIKTMAGEDIENGQILIEGGVIKAVGVKLEVPTDAQVIDAKGALVTPGLIDGHCHIGLIGEGIGFEGSDVNETSDPVTPQMRAIDGINPMTETFPLALQGGVTTAITGPGSANVIGGTFAAIKLYGKRIDNMILKEPVAMKIAFGENPKRVYGTSNKTPRTRMATAAILRDNLSKAQRYYEELLEYEKPSEDGKPKKKPAFDMKMESFLPVMRKEIPLKAHAHQADDIFTSIRIAKEFGLEVTLDHCTEGHLIVDELVSENKSIFVGPTFGSKSKFELQNKTFDTPKALIEAGLLVAIVTDSPVIPLQYLSLCAGLAVKAGLCEQEAWKAITINPAKICGIDSRVGSIEVGKDADIVIFDGNPLKDIDYKTVCTIVNGQVVYKAE